MSTTPHLSPARRLTPRLCPLVLAAALATALVAQPVQAASRHWTFIGGCASADWLSTTAGPNAQGRFTCWSETFGGLSGAAPPGVLDDAFIVAPQATSTLLVGFAAPVRPAFVGQVHDLTLYGNASFAAGLNVERHTLLANRINIGVSGLPFLGRMDQSGGGVSAGTLNVYGGEYNLAAGQIHTGFFDINGAAALTGRYHQTGGALVADTVVARTDAGDQASLSVLGGSGSSNRLYVGDFGNAGTVQAVIAGGSTRWTNTEFIIVRAGTGTAELNLRDGARVESDRVLIGARDSQVAVLGVSGAGTTLSVADRLDVGSDSGDGRLEISQGGTVSARSVAVNALPGVPGSAPTLGVSLAGAGTQLEARAALYVAVLTDAAVDVADGATLRSTGALIGMNPGRVGVVRLRGSGGALWDAGDALYVGSLGRGYIDVSGAQSLRSAEATLGSEAGSFGQVVLGGAQASWSNPGRLTVGADGVGDIRLASGSSLDSGLVVLGEVDGAAGSLLASGSGTVLKLQGGLVAGDLGAGTFTADSAALADTPWLTLGRQLGSSGNGVVQGAGTLWRNATLLTLGEAGAGTLAVSSGAHLQTAAATLGALPVGRGALTVASGASVAIAGRFDVGPQGRGDLNIAAGGRLESGASALGGPAGSLGLATVAGSGAQWQVNGALDLGGSGVLTVGVGGEVTVGQALRAATDGRVVLDGGTLRADAVLLKSPDMLDWRGGVLHVNGAGGLALDDLQLPSLLSLRSGRELRVDQTLALGASSTLLLAGGRLVAGTLALDDAVLATSGGVHALDMDGIGTLAGRGQVTAPVQGGLGHRITALGQLTLGLASRDDGYAFGGTLELGHEQVLLLDRDLADLGTHTMLADGATLATVNGARLASGGRLDATGNARVQGHFVNDGQVTAADGTLSFLDDVSGTGGYSGALRFLAGYAPGHSTAEVGFGAGDLAFGPQSLLTLEIDGTTPGLSFDRLADIGMLQFDGTLALAFGAGFGVAADTRLSLLDFDAFAGRLDATRVRISGYDPARLDLSRLALDGTVGISAVPEAQTLALWLAGLGVVALRARRLRGA